MTGKDGGRGLDPDAKQKPVETLSPFISSAAEFYEFRFADFMEQSRDPLEVLAATWGTRASAAAQAGLALPASARFAPPRPNQSIFTAPLAICPAKKLGKKN